MKQTNILTRICFSLIISIGLFLGFLTFKAEAAGAMKFDFENSGGTAQEDRYSLTNDTWTLSGTKKYEYYTDGTLKTVRSEDGDFPYEGHYDPHGHLMDPSWSFYTGYLEGIMYDEYPARFYDSEGKLTHFEAVRIDIDTTEPLIIKADYEYDKQNRVSRVSYQTDYLDDDLKRISKSEAKMSTGYVFSYAEDGNYSITAENSYDADQVYRTTFSYDKNRRLAKYDVSSKTVSSYDGKLYSNSEVYQYYYDENGNLIREAVYRGDEQAPVSTEYRYRKEGDAIQFCDVYQAVQGSDEPEYAYTIKSVFDEKGRVIEENSETFRNYRYEFRDITAEVGAGFRKITDIKYYNSAYDSECYGLMLMSDGTVAGSNLEAFFPQESIDKIFSWDGIVQIEACDAGIIGLRRDGKVVAVNNPNDPHYADYEYGDIVESTQGWQKVKKLILSGGGLYALTYDGDVLVPGKLIEPMFAEYQDWDYTKWSDLNDLISYGSPQGSGLFGLKRNGKILCRYPLIQGERETNLPQFEEEPRNVIAIDSSEFLFVCLMADGTVSVAGSEAYYDSFLKEIRDLFNVAQVLALNSSVAVRFDDGTVKVIHCYDDFSALNTEEISSWQDICQIYTNRYQLFALDKNGRVHVADNKEKIGNLDKNHIEGWKNIDEMTVYGTFYGESYLLAWQSDGTLLTEGLSGLHLFYP